MSDPYTRNEQKEFLARLESERDRLNDANRRQDARLDKLEKAFDKLEQLAISVNTLMHNVNSLSEDIKAQSAKLKHIEEKGAKRWEEVVTQIIKLLVATITGYILARIGFQS